MMKMKFILIVLLCCSIDAIAQTDSTFLTDDVDIQTTLKPNNIYSFSGMNNVTVTSNSLMISNSFESREFSLGDLRDVRVQTSSHGKQGVIIGGVGGFLLGFISGMISSGGDNGGDGLTSTKWGVGLLGGVIIGGVCAVVGGLIGEGAPVFKDAGIGKIPENSKRDALIGFIKKHSIEQ